MFNYKNLYVSQNKRRQKTLKERKMDIKLDAIEVHCKIGSYLSHDYAYMDHDSYIYIYIYI